uniref:Uncharacterized protein n=1 Tax=Rhizophora mucronata TaxID=61149 RepID=A0A2P2PFW1_RHIMU
MRLSLALALPLFYTSFLTTNLKTESS